MTAGKRQQGSVIILVVGVLVMLGMIGATFIMFTFMDRRQSSTLATVAPMDKVALGVVDGIRLNRFRDLHIGGTPPTLYGDTTLLASYKQQIDYPQECPSDVTASGFFDQVLSSACPVQDASGAWIWKHVANFGATVNNSLANVATSAANLVDTDGDGIRDAVLWDSGIFVQSGPTIDKYYFAVRLVDASARMNLNTAYATAAAAAGTVMPVTNVSMDLLTDPNMLGVSGLVPPGNAPSLRDALTLALHNARRGTTAAAIAAYNNGWVVRPNNPAPPTGLFLPFDVADQLCIIWAGTPSTATGRLYTTFVNAVNIYNSSNGTTIDPNAVFRAARPYLTGFSSERDATRYKKTSTDPNFLADPNYVADSILVLTRRADVNSASADLAALFKAFYNAIPAGVAGLSDGANATAQDTKRRTTAAQLAVNAIDYRDADGNVTVADVPGVTAPVVTVYGLERQPYITELFLKKFLPVGGPVSQYSAIEMFNPYDTDISLDKWEVWVGGAKETATFPASLPAKGRLVIRSDSTAIPVAAGATTMKVINLRLADGVRIVRPRNADGSGTVDVVVATATVPLADPAEGPAPFQTLQWDDREANARWALPQAQALTLIDAAHDYTNNGEGGTGDRAATTTNLGVANDGTLDDVVGQPCPVFVRNGPFVSVGELPRVFYVGPTTTQSLSESLTNVNDVSNGRLNVLGALVPEPATPTPALNPGVPTACLLSDYLAVLTPSGDNTGATDTIYGKININTAPWPVIACLPGLNQLDPTIRERAARDIVAYRDLLNNTASGGRDYSTAGARATNTGVTSLRQAAGFASCGEIAIPLRKVAGLTLPNNNYGGAGKAYRLAGASDDGLADITGDLSKYDIYYAWLSNQVSVRSDVYIATIRVQLGNSANPSGPVRRYVAVIDRSNCNSTATMPRVLLFTEIK